ncbi:hypothetical protein SISNIDRAFT_470756 [Sistotremastrum niveocremeum HHB9708]|uniref:Amine oxidase domain-containing protein n=2 Tax=Sistotremastraceae TaxID=3402574 RepID=A0A164NI90_9AGAM|nr:hypothetical protein SISNIDRAFT_470756 [Sistotremastrum niveocremeum HHB9708]KZT35363.1 hypothetical protein SISSUDRAFT_174231 [Sistotremastrum suecicum HHB10207 ss-3]
MAEESFIPTHGRNTNHNVFAQRGRYIQKKHITELERHPAFRNLPALENLKSQLRDSRLHKVPYIRADPDARDDTSSDSSSSDESAHVVGIIGAGMAGLYTAMILKSLGIKYKILEGSDRLGGRMFTHHFPGTGKYDYYDVGAMRFPDTQWMKRTFDLVRNRGLQGLEFIPYLLKSDHTFNCYNGSSVVDLSKDPVDPFKVSTYVSTSDYANPLKARAIIGDALEEPRQLFRDNDLETAIKLLFEQYDSYSMRAWLLVKNPTLTSSDLHWIQTVGASTGTFDRGLADVVLDSVAFDYPQDQSGGNAQPIQWSCFNGGSSTLPEAMRKSLKGDADDDKDTLQFKSLVTAISEFDQGTMLVTYNKDGKEVSEEFSAVICTIPLPRLSFVNLHNTSMLQANYAQWSAIRELRYGISIKIGIRFKTAWWETLDSGIIKGGQSNTDFPIRNIVYPSYPAGDSKAKVIIVSYCKSADADRMSAFIDKDGTADPILIDQVFRDLANVHNVTLEYLQARFDDTPSKKNFHAWNWQADPFAAGAFAFFTPGQYSDPIYERIRAPAANGKLFFAGEHCSACHAWVAGALESSWVSVYSFLKLWNVDKVDDFKKKWGSTEYWDEDVDEEEFDVLFDKVLRLGIRPYVGSTIISPNKPQSGVKGF